MEGRKSCEVAHLALLGVKRQEPSPRIYMDYLRSSELAALFFWGTYMRRRTGLLIVLFAVLALFMGLTNESSNNKKTQDKTTEHEEASQIEPDTVDGYTYSEIENMVLYLAQTDEDRQEIGRMIDPLSKSQQVNAGFLKSVMRIIDAPDELYKEEMAGLEDESIVAAELFDAIYSRIVNSGLVSGLQHQSVYVFDVFAGQNEDDAEYYLSDTKNTYKLDAELSLEYRDSIIDVFVRDDIIFKVNGLSDDRYTLENVWLVSAYDGECEFVCDGLIKSYRTSGEYTNNNSKIIGRVARLVLDNNGVCDIECYSKSKNVKIEEIRDNGFSTSEDGFISRTGDFVIYNASRDIFCEDSFEILRGYSEVELVFDGDNAIAAIIRDELYSEDIRVIISNDSYTSYDMKKVTVSCDCRFKVTYPDEHNAYYNEGDEVTITYDSYKRGDKIYFEPVDYYGRLVLCNINRSYGHPAYEGILEIDILDKSIHVINELPLESYLYSVVASEMPATSEPEALKALAICARGYAYNKMHDGSFSEYNAHLDDSSLCQVYNNVEETKQSIKAVKDTYGIVTKYNGAVTVSLYFSTSCGVTCTNEEIWGGNAHPYLKTNVETESKKEIDLSSEEQFRKFMDNSLGYDTIEKELPYYRWHIDYTDEEMTEAISMMLQERINISSDNIKVLNENGDFKKANGNIDMGQIKSVEVKERTVSGVVSRLEIEGTGATIEVTGQTNIRSLITPVNQTIVRQDGFEVKGWTSLPSPFYYIDKTDKGFTIYGGGFGHGVGMSQNGANILAEEGHNYQYILRHYYSSIDFDVIYDVTSDSDDD